MLKPLTKDLICGPSAVLKLVLLFLGYLDIDAAHSWHTDVGRFFISLLVRANLPLIVALQWISNPLTMGPIYFADYKIGLSVLNLLGVDYQRNKLLSAEYNWSEFTFQIYCD